jgi:hypothetical protein
MHGSGVPVALSIDPRAASGIVLGAGVKIPNPPNLVYLTP